MDQNPLETIETIDSTHDVGPIVFGPLYDENDQNPEQDADEYLLSTIAHYTPANIRRMRSVGTIGQPIDLVVNCIKLFSNPHWKLQKYRVHFNPNFQTNIKNELLIKHKSILGEFVFHGYHLYTSVKYGQEKFILYDYDGPDGLLVMITLNHVGEVQESDLIRVPILMKFLLNCFCHSNCVKVESKYYDLETTVTNIRLGIKYLPGYEFGLGEIDGQLILRIGLTNKFETTETVLDFFRVSCGNDRNSDPILINNFKASIIGTVVLTSYNNKLYKICDVDENLNIYSTFINRNESNISYMDYYKQKWDITIMYAEQPLLKTRELDENGTLKIVYLVPELCIITKLTKIIGNKALFKELNQYTDYEPNKKIFKYKQFFSKLHSKTKFINTLKTWNLHLGEDFIKVSGRILPTLYLNTFEEMYPIESLGNWTKEIRHLGMIVAPKVESWVILTPSKYFLKVEKFAQTLRLLAELIEICLPIPEIIQMNDECQRTYMNHLDDIIKNNVHKLILCVIKSLHSDLSNKINRKLCIGAAVPSQLISLKQVTINDHSKCFKTAIRINCKLGGVPWLVHFPMQKFMVVGLDIYRDLHDKHKYFCAVMASMDNSCTRYFSFLELLCEENISEFFVLTIAKAIYKFKDQTKAFPKGVIIYRDGLEFDTINMNSICVSEIISLMKQRNEFDDGVNSMIPFVYITIQKNYKTKLFSEYGPENYRNPPIGTIVDTDITDPIIHDFLLISHKSKSGTVQPTYYCVAYNCIPNITINEIQMFTYMLTHMYFNSPYSIRVPAPCRMAYDLAYFSANTLKTTQNILLHGFPFFF